MYITISDPCHHRKNRNQISQSLLIGHHEKSGPAGERWIFCGVELYARMGRVEADTTSTLIIRISCTLHSPYIQRHSPPACALRYVHQMDYVLVLGSIWAVGFCELFLCLWQGANTWQVIWHDPGNSKMRGGPLQLPYL